MESINKFFNEHEALSDMLVIGVFVGAFIISALFYNFTTTI